MHQPWVSRVTGQLLAACDGLESEIRRAPLASTSATINQAGVSAAVAWHFLQMTRPEVVNAASYPALNDFSAQAEMMTEFQAAPHGSGSYVVV